MKAKNLKLIAKTGKILELLLTFKIQLLQRKYCQFKKK